MREGVPQTAIYFRLPGGEKDDKQQILLEPLLEATQTQNQFSRYIKNLHIIPAGGRKWIIPMVD